MRSFAPPRRAVGAVAAAALVLAGCGSDDPLASCDTLPDAAIQLLKDMVAASDDLTPADLSGDEAPAGFAALVERGEELSKAGEDLNCDEDTFNQAVEARIDEVEVEPGSIGAVLVESLKNAGFG